MNTPLDKTPISEIRRLCIEAQELGFVVHSTSEGIKLTYKRPGIKIVSKYPSILAVRRFLEGVSVGKTIALQQREEQG